MLFQTRLLQTPQMPAAPGLYIVTRAKAPGITHYGILDIGNRLQLSGVQRGQAMVVHQIPPHVRVESWRSSDSWTRIARIADERGATERIREAFRNPKYDLFGNNCEHFARFVGVGERRSEQIIAAGAVAVLILAVLFLSD